MKLSGSEPRTKLELPKPRQREPADRVTLVDEVKRFERKVRDAAPFERSEKRALVSRPKSQRAEQERVEITRAGQLDHGGQLDPAESSMRSAPSESDVISFHSVIAEKTLFVIPRIENALSRGASLGSCSSPS